MVRSSSVGGAAVSGGFASSRKDLSAFISVFGRSKLHSLVHLEELRHGCGVIAADWARRPSSRLSGWATPPHDT